METIEEVRQVNGINVETLGGTVDAIRNDPGLGEGQFRVSNRWIAGNLNVSTISSFYGARQDIPHKITHEVHADEPAILAGDDNAPNPVEILLSSLAACLTTSLVAHAAVKGIRIDELESEVEGDLNLNGYLGLDPSVQKGYQSIRVKFRVKTDERNETLLRKLALFSPVFNTLKDGTDVSLELHRV